MFVDELAFEAKVPVDGPKPGAKNDVTKTRFFADLPQSRFFRTFAPFQMALWKSPIAVGVFDEEGVDQTIDPPEDDPPGTPLRLGSLPRMEA